MITAVFFGVVAATIALTMNIGETSNVQYAFWFAAIASIITGIVNIRQTITVASIEAQDDHHLLMLMGLHPGSLRWIIRCQALVSGCIGSTLGVTIGLALTYSLTPKLASMGIDEVANATVDASGWRIGLAVLGGLVSTLIAAWGPSRRATVSTITRHRRFSPVIMTSIGIIMMSIGVIISIYTTEYQWMFTSVVMVILGAYVSFPSIFTGCLLGLRAITASWHMPSLKLAVRSLAARKSSAVSVALAFTVGVMFLGAITVIGSWSSEADSESAALEYHGTLKINNLLTGSTPQAFRDSDVQDWAEMSDVQSVYTLQGESLDVASSSSSSSVFLYRIHPYHKTSNPFQDLFIGHPEAAKAFSNGEIIIGSKDAKRYGFHVGDQLTIKNTTTNASQQLRIGYVIDGYITTGLYINDAKYPIDHATSAYIVAKPDVNTHDFITRWVNTYGDDYLGQNQLDRVRQWGTSALKTMLVEYAAASLVITVSVLGLMTMMALTIMQRKRELGLLSAYGYADSMLKRSLWIEGMLITGVSGLYATIIGSVIGVIIGQSMMAAGSIPIMLLSWLVIASIIMGLMSSIIPGAVAVRHGATELRDE
jgi:putative ABC transport system permease protein